MAKKKDAELHELQAWKAEINQRIYKAKRRKHYELYYDHKWLFKLLDVLVVLVVLFNFGAIAITNMIVVKEEPAAQIYEINPVAASNLDVKLHPDYRALMWTIVKQSLGWLVVISFYVYHRLMCYRKWHVIMMASLVGYYLIVLGGDFFNDLGFLLGRSVFG